MFRVRHRQLGGRSYGAAVFLLVFLLGAGPGAAADAPGPMPRGFVLGVSQGDEKAVPYLQELGLGWNRIGIPLRALTPELIEPGLRPSDVMGNAARVRALARRVDWSATDERMRSLIRRGIRPVPIVGHGYKQFYARINGEDAYPDRIGRDHYLAQMYWSVRATVERYDGDGVDDADGIVIKVWQLENELNQAGLTAAWGWREPSWLGGLSSAWNDWGFLTRLLDTLHRAVKDADPEALTFMNFHTDVPDDISRLMGARPWLDAVKEWKGRMEIIGFDAYPNYYAADPVRGDVVGERTRLIKEASGGMPVWVIETDYPTGPAERGFTPEKQAAFLRTSYDSARAAGVSGYFKFYMIGSDTHDTAITEQDLKNLATVVPLWEGGHTFKLFTWALFHLGYVNSHFLDVVKTVEGYWGMVAPEGEPKPAFFVMQDIARENAAGEGR